MALPRLRNLVLPGIFTLLCSIPAAVFADEPLPTPKKFVVGTRASVPKIPARAPAPQKNIFVEHFYMPPALRVQYNTWEAKGFVFVETPNRGRNARYSIVTGFGPNVLKTRFLPGFQKPEEIRKWVSENQETAAFEEVEIRRLPVGGTKENPEYLYWVGHRSFASADQAQAEIALAQSITQAEGFDFSEMVKAAQTAMRVAEEEPPVEIKTPAQFQKEEEIMLKFLDQLDVGNEIFGVLQGEGSGEAIVWQSFGETTWRMTNLDKRNFSDQVGFWTNRLVLKGIRAPLSSIDPFVESTAALESNGVDFASHLDLSAGVEWRPFSRNPWLLNYRPWSLPLLEWIRNYRFFMQYFDRKNLKDEIAASRDYDLVAGVQIFYEWGIDLPPATEGDPEGIPDYLRRYVWGEYFGSYRYEKTNFGSQDDFNAFIWNSSVILGVRLPGIPLPANPINDELVFMPYMHFEHVNNTEFSFPFQNRYFVGAGVRWMPFRTYRYKENEWLSKVKIFGEYVGVGRAQNAKQDGEAPNAIDYDLRFGLSFSQRRF